MTHNPLVYQGKICPYCGSPTEYVDSSVVYTKSYGMIYLCSPCKAFVGVHKGTDKALGRLANEELREWKKKAHAVFDPIWEEAMNRGASKFEARNNTYQWLSEAMGKKYQVHIGQSDVEECKQIVELCESFHTEGRMIEFTKKANLIFPDLSAIRFFDNEDFMDVLREWCNQQRVSLKIIQNYQLRFFNLGQKLDVFQQSRKYHDITGNRRGTYDDLFDLLNFFFKESC